MPTPLKPLPEGLRHPAAAALVVAILEAIDGEGVWAIRTGDPHRDDVIEAFNAGVSAAGDAALRVIRGAGFDVVPREEPDDDEED